MIKWETADNKKGLASRTKPEKQYKGLRVKHRSIVGKKKHNKFTHKPHNKGSAHLPNKALKGSEERTFPYDSSPQSPEGFETDTHDEGAGLWTADMQGFVLWLFRSAFIKSAAEGRPFFPQGSSTENEAVTLALSCSDLACVVTAGPEEG